MSNGIFQPLDMHHVQPRDVDGVKNLQAVDGGRRYRHRRPRGICVRMQDESAPTVRGAAGPARRTRPRWHGQHHQRALRRAIRRRRRPSRARRSGRSLGAAAPDWERGRSPRGR